MPLVKIEILEGNTPEFKKAIFNAVHSALMEGIGIPDHDRKQRIIEYHPDNFEIPPGRSEKFTLIDITLFPGRSLDAKRKFYQALSRNLQSLGIPPLDVLITLHEPPLENWGVRGGIAATDLNISINAGSNL